MVTECDNVLWKFVIESMKSRRVTSTVLFPSLRTSAGDFLIILSCPSVGDIQERAAPESG
jgi:hypothetical protein